MNSIGPIVTLTLNPALDVSASVDVVSPTHKLRCVSPRTEPGGGGINVSRVCLRLGAPTVAVLPLGGANGRRVEELLHGEQVATRSVPIEDETRESFTVSEGSTGDQFRFVLPGPSLSPNEVQACLEVITDAAGGSSSVVVSGSVPSGIDESFFAGLVDRLPGARVIVDTSGPALDWALASGAHLLKPSARELAAVVGRDLRTEAEVAAAARDVVDRTSVENVIVSIGAGGAIAVPASGPAIRLRAPTVQVRSAVGAGDAMVAGIAVGLQRGLDLAEACALGIAAGTAAVLSEGSALCSVDDVEALLPLVVVD